MSKIGDAVKRTFVQIVAVIAIVVIAVYAIALFAPGAIAGAFGLGAGASSMSAAGIAWSVASSTYFTASAGIMMAMQLYGAYTLDKETAAASERIKEHKEETESELREHFSEMEEDRYDAYDGPQLGISWPKEVEEEFEKDYGHDDVTSSSSSTGLLVTMGLLVGGAYALS